SEETLTGKIINAIITVHSTLGPGFIEGPYKRALAIECRKRGIRFEVEKEFTIFYDGEEIGTHRLDMLVEDAIVVEAKTVERLAKVRYAQVRSYLKATGLKVGILVNFATEMADFRRVEL
ncbi:MAG: GxxExxY protein, partial [Candidatus Hydrogenedentes bacterium]|nr:GxxExxY protein [Candidatus Hydrogenedentota bacterium]